MRTLITLVEQAATGGFIVVSKGKVQDGTDNGLEFWSAVFYKKRPKLVGPEYADEVLVQSDSRAAKSRATTLAIALKKKPNAEVIEVN